LLRSGVIPDQFVVCVPQIPIADGFGRMPGQRKCVRQDRWQLGIDKKAHGLGRLEDCVIGLCRRELQTCANVFGFQIREVLKDFGFGYAGGKKLKHVNDPNTHAAQAGPSSTLLGIEGYPIEVTHT
jgi:hypothetical protein